MHVCVCVFTSVLLWLSTLMSKCIQVRGSISLLQRCCLYMFASTQQQTGNATCFSNWPWNRETCCILSQTSLSNQYQHPLCTGAHSSFFPISTYMVIFPLSSRVQQHVFLCTQWIIYCMSLIFPLSHYSSPAVSFRQLWVLVFLWKISFVTTHRGNNFLCFPYFMAVKDTLWISFTAYIDQLS